MSDSVYRVETTSRVAQWRIENLASFTYRKSDPFKIGKWNWHLSVEKNRTLIIKLYPEISNITRQHPPIASFVIKVVSSVGDRKCLVHPEITDKLLKSNEDFVWAIEAPLTGKFIIDIEFLDLKTTSLDVRCYPHHSVPLRRISQFGLTQDNKVINLESNIDHQVSKGQSKGNEPCSIWRDGFTQRQSHETALSLLGRMLSESIHTDIVINASDGSISAHRAVLASRSPVFRSMFTHNLREKEMSAINISDMSVEACSAFMSYIYGSIRNEEFLAHRLSLLRAADKYDILDLKEACHQSLVGDIDTGNVLERLQNATLYQLPKLKNSCLLYLVKFGKVFDIRDDFNVFLQCADRELVAEIFNEVLATWKGF